MTGGEIEGKLDQGMEKRNFIRWYRDVSPGEIKKVKGEGRRILQRLFIEYTDEIEVINKSKCHISHYPNQS